MGVDASELFVAGDGRVYRGAVNAAFPTNLTDDPTESVWADLGYATVEGVQLSVEPEYADVFAWQSLRYIRRIKSTVAEHISMTFQQWTRGTVLTAFGGGTFTEPTPGDYYYNPPLPADRDEFAMIFDVDDGSERMRWCFRKVQNTSTIETQFSRESEAQLPVTVDVLDPGSGLSPWFFRTNATRFEDYGS